MGAGALIGFKARGMKRFEWPDPARQTAFPVARPGFSFIYAAGFFTAVMALLGLKVPALVGLVALFAICGFFRDPDRVTPTEAGAVVAPADGKVVVVQTVTDSAFYAGPCLKISIFMSVFNVHVNRMAHEGRVADIHYFPGKFFSANLDKASRDNEHNAIFVDTPCGNRLVMVQIAGLIARRIICGVTPGADLVRGQRIGMICFGSRVDVYLPPETRAAIKVGDKVTAGASILGHLPVTRA
jgi:phosphatidylserine decarboxylase